MVNKVDTTLCDDCVAARERKDLEDRLTRHLQAQPKIHISADSDYQTIVASYVQAGLPVSPVDLPVALLYHRVNKKSVALLWLTVIVTLVATWALFRGLTRNSYRFPVITF